jgi:peroxiredoxin
LSASPWIWRGWLLVALAAQLHAQGLLPSKTEQPSNPRGVSRPLLIGESVPETLSGIDENGKQRTLLSYKSPLEVLVVTYLTANCPAKQALWPKFQRFYASYKGWRVAFLAVSPKTQTAASEVAAALRHEKLPWRVLRDDTSSIVSKLKITGTPEVLIIDEYGTLRYRGPLAQTSAAMDSIIGHLQAVQNPEPPLEDACPLQ